MPSQKISRLPFSRLQQTDLMKIFTKMHCRELCKFHRTSKGLQQFLNENLTAVPIFTRNSLVLHLKKLDDSTLRIKMDFSDLEKVSFEWNPNEELSEEHKRIEEYFKTIGISFELSYLGIYTNHVRDGAVPDPVEQQLNRAFTRYFINFLTENRIRVKNFHPDSLKPGMDIFSQLKPKYFEANEAYGLPWEETETPPETPLLINTLKVMTSFVKNAETAFKYFKPRRLVIKFDHDNFDSIIPVMQETIREIRNSGPGNYLTAFIKGKTDADWGSCFPLSSFPESYEVSAETIRLKYDAATNYPHLATNTTVRYFVEPLPNSIILLRVSWTFYQEDGDLSEAQVACAKCKTKNEADILNGYKENFEMPVVKQIYSKYFGTVYS